MVTKEEMTAVAKELPRTYPDFYNYIYLTTSRRGCEQEIYDFMLEHPDSTPSDVLKKMWDIVGKPAPLKIIDTETGEIYEQEEYVEKLKREGKWPIK